MAGRGSKGEADAEFLRALLNEKSDRAENSDRDEGKRHKSEAADKNQIELGAAQGIADELVDSFYVVERLILIEGVGRVADCAEGRSAWKARRYNDGRTAVWLLRKGNIEDVEGNLIWAELLGVLRYAHDLNGRLGRNVTPFFGGDIVEHFSEGIFRTKQRVCRVAIDNSDARRSLRVVGIQRATCKKTHVKHAEEIWIDSVYHDLGAVLVAKRLARHVDGVSKF